MFVRDSTGRGSGSRAGGEPTSLPVRQADPASPSPQRQHHRGRGAGNTPSGQVLEGGRLRLEGGRQRRRHPEPAGRLAASTLERATHSVRGGTGGDKMVVGHRTIQLQAAGGAAYIFVWNGRCGGKGQAHWRCRRRRPDTRWRSATPASIEPWWWARLPSARSRRCRRRCRAARAYFGTDRLAQAGGPQAERRAERRRVLRVGGAQR